MDNIWIVIITPIATVICNAIYILIVKKDLDRRLEQYKIAYSGIFKEKLEHYKQLLMNMDKLKDMVVQYGNAGSQSKIEPIQIMTEFNKFIRFNEYGSIYYTNEIETIVTQIRKDFQEVFDASYKMHYLRDNRLKGIDISDYFTKLIPLVNGESYNLLKKKLIQNIREDFGINK